MSPICSTSKPECSLLSPVLDALACSESFQQDRRELFELVQTHSFRKGDFVLASGKRSNYYIDCRTTTLSGRGSYLIGRLFYQCLLQSHIDSVGGVVIGAAPMVTSITCESAYQGHPLEGFLIRKEAKGHGTGKQVEGHMAPWMRVALVEDVVSTGGSIVKGINALRKAYPSVEIVKVLSIVDRELGGREALAELSIPYQSLYSVHEFLQE